MSNDQHIPDLTGLHIWDGHGVERFELTGEYTSERLAETLVDTWIPYFECHQCGRWDYCKYPRQHPANPNRPDDIQCGVAKDAIHSLVKRTFDILQSASAEGQQDWTDRNFKRYFTPHAALELPWPI